MNELDTPYQFGAESPDEQRFNDDFVRTVVRGLTREYILPAVRAQDDPLAGFEEAARTVSASFEVPVSSITTRMARFLFAVSSMIRPRTVACVGSAWGNSLVWLALGTPSAMAIGIDVDPSMVRASTENYRRANIPARFETMDATHEDRWSTLLGGRTLDLVLLDADAPHDSPAPGKLVNVSIINALEQHLASPSVLMVHDACHPKFSDDFTAIRKTLKERLDIERIATLPLDRCGIDIGSRATHDVSQ